MNIVKFKREIAGAALLATMASCAWPMGFGQTVDPDQRFYGRKSEGWFWYEPEPEEAEPDKPEKPKPPAPKPAAPINTPSPQAATSAGPPPPAPFSAAWFRENLQKYRDAAWDNPTVENVRAFMYMQRFAMDRSETVSNATELAVIGDPYLDENSRRPSATFASQKLDVGAGKERESLLQSVSNRVGIFFFFNDDEYSSIQASIVKMLENTGFTIVPISVSGKPLKDNIYPNFKVDKGHAKSLNIMTFPATFLVSPDGKFEPIGQGAMSLPEMKHRILIAAKRNGWVSDEEFRKTKPLYGADNNIAEKLDASIFGKNTESNNTDKNNKTNFVEPSKLMEHIRARLKTN